MVRGECADPFLAAMIRSFWKLSEKLQVGVWIGRVGSKVNPADLPTRKKTLPFPIQRTIQFESLFALLCEMERTTLSLCEACESNTPIKIFPNSLDWGYWIKERLKSLF